MISWFVGWLRGWTEFWRGQDWWLCLMFFMLLAVLAERSITRIFWALVWWREARAARRGENVCPMCGQRRSRFP